MQTIERQTSAITQAEAEEMDRRIVARRGPSRGGCVSPPYGLDWIARPYFDPLYPGVREWARAEGPEIVLTPELSGGRVRVEGPEILVSR